MKQNKPVLTVIVLFFALAACNKTGLPVIQAVVKPTIIAKWQLVKDSDIYHNTPKGSTTNYNGRPGDYFDFRKNGKCYTKERGLYDTLSYRLITDTTAVIQDFVFGGLNNNANSPNYYSLIKPLTEHYAVITSPDLLIPGAGGGGSHRIVVLKR
jgi:hypothetical protein